MPDLLQRTLAQHTPDADGYCRECREYRNSLPVAAPWPCAARTVAEEAQHLQRLEHGPTTESGRHRSRHY